MKELISLLLGLAALTSTISAAPAHIENYGNIPLAFTINQGQHDSSIHYTAQVSGCEMAFSPTGTTFLLSRETPASVAKRTAKIAGDPRQNQPEYESFALKLAFIGANSNPEIQGEDRLPWNNNYFIGNEPSKWQTDVPNYKKIRFKEVYKGIDLVYYGNQKRVKYDFVVKPGEDTEQILLKYDFGGKEGSIEINQKGELVIKTQVGVIIEKKPYCYQKINGKEIEIPIKYNVVGDGTYRFLVDEYEKGCDLVIDPEIVYSTYLGGLNEDSGTSIAVDNQGNAYVTGQTDGGFPVTMGAFNENRRQIFITKMNSKGNALLYSTYIGGTAVNGYDTVESIAVDKEGNAFIYGNTSHKDFPTTTGAYLTSFNSGGRLFITKINKTGNQLLYSTFFGGSIGNIATSLALDEGGNAYLTGEAGASDFPTTSGAYREKLQTTRDVFVSKLNSDGSGLIYSTFLGSGYGQVIQINLVGEVYIAGETGSADFPVTANAFDKSIDHSQKGFITKLNSTGSDLIFSTFLGGSGDNYVTGITLDKSENVYVAGYTSSSDFPVTLGAFQVKYGGNTDAFVTKLDNTGSSLIYSTYLGGQSLDYILSIIVNENGNAFIAGVTSSKDFPSTTPGEMGSFLLVFNPLGNSLIYSIFHVFGKNMTCDQSGNFYFTGAAGAGLITTSGAYDETYNWDGNPTITPSDAYIIKYYFGDIKSVVTVSEQPQDFKITSVYPNPFNSFITIDFYLPISGDVTFTIYNILGQKVRELISKNMSYREHSFRWDGKNDNGLIVSSGFYIMKLQIDKRAVSKNVLFLK
jgi:hypothetical protein